MLVQIPRDFHALKRSDIALARAWREHTREMFRSAFARGYCVTDFLCDAERSVYLLQQRWESACEAPARIGTLAPGPRCAVADVQTT